MKLIPTVTCTHLHAQELYSGRRAELEAAQDRVRQDLKAEWEARYWPQGKYLKSCTETTWRVALKLPEETVRKLPEELH